MAFLLTNVVFTSAPGFELTLIALAKDVSLYFKYNFFLDLLQCFQVFLLS